MLNTFLPVKDVSVYNTPSYVTVINLMVISTASQRTHQHLVGRDGYIAVFNSSVQIIINLYSFSTLCAFCSTCLLAHTYLMYKFTQISHKVFIRYFIQSKHINIQSIIHRFGYMFRFIKPFRANIYYMKVHSICGYIMGSHIVYTNKS